MQKPLVIRALALGLAFIGLRSVSLAVETGFRLPEKPVVFKTVQELVSYDWEVRMKLVVFQLEVRDGPGSILAFAASFEKADASKLPRDVQEAHGNLVKVIKAHAKTIEEDGGLSDQLLAKRGNPEVVKKVVKKLGELNYVMSNAIKGVEEAAAKHGPLPPIEQRLAE